MLMEYCCFLERCKRYYGKCLDSTYYDFSYFSSKLHKTRRLGTSFLSEVAIGDVISLANLSTLGETLGDAAVVTSVESNTVLRIDRNFQAAKNLTNLYVAAFRPDATKDAIVADISRPT